MVTVAVLAYCFLCCFCDSPVGCFLSGCAGCCGGRMCKPGLGPWMLSLGTACPSWYTLAVGVFPGALFPGHQQPDSSIPSLPHPPAPVL